MLQIQSPLSGTVHPNRHHRTLVASLLPKVFQNFFQAANDTPCKCTERALREAGLRPRVAWASPCLQGTFFAGAVPVFQIRFFTKILAANREKSAVMIATKAMILKMKEGVYDCHSGDHVEQSSEDVTGCFPRNESHFSNSVARGRWRIVHQGLTLNSRQWSGRRGKGKATLSRTRPTEKPGADATSTGSSANFTITRFAH